MESSFALLSPPPPPPPIQKHSQEGWLKVPTLELTSSFNGSVESITRSLSGSPDEDAMGMEEGTDHHGDDDDDGDAKDQNAAAIATATIEDTGSGNKDDE